MAAVTAHILSVTRSPLPAPDTNALGPTGPKPTARSNATTAHCSTNGPTPSPTSPKPTGAPPCPHGYTTTTITDTTPASADHPPAAYPTSRVRTASVPRRKSVG